MFDHREVSLSMQAACTPLAGLTFCHSTQTMHIVVALIAAGFVS